MTTQPTIPQDGSPSISMQVFQREQVDHHEYELMRLSDAEFQTYAGLADGSRQDPAA